VTNDKEYPCLTRLDADCFRAQPGWAKQALAYRLLKCLAPGQITRRLPKGLRLALLTPGIPLPPGINIPPLVDTPPVLPPGVPGTGPDAPLYGGTWTPGPMGGGETSPISEVLYTITAETSDGWIYHSHHFWATARNAASGTGRNATTTERDGATRTRWYWVGYEGFHIERSWFVFDLTSIPAGGSASSIVFTLMQYSKNNSVVCVQEGTQGDTLELGDYGQFTGPLFATKTWTTGLQEITLNAAGKAYIESKFGSKAYLCCREHTHDYLDVPPPSGTDYANGLYYANHPTQANKPQLVITL